MKRPSRSWWLAVLVLAWALSLPLRAPRSQAGEPPEAPLLVGAVRDRQGQPVREATVTLHGGPGDEALAQAVTQPDGRYALALPEVLPAGLAVRIERPHIVQARLDLGAEEIQDLEAGSLVVLPDTTLPRRITAAFWIATAVFVAVLAFIATSTLHNTLAALLGASLILAVSYLGRPLSEDLFVFDFAGAMRYVDWNVIFLIMGMMIVIAVIERTGIFQWLAFQAYRLSGGRLWLLLPILMVVTGVASAFLDNVTTMLLMTPISVQIALAMGLNPLALLMPVVMASNVAGISTLVGTPTNILIGSYGRISFNDFLVNLTPGVLLALLGLVIYSELAYRQEFQASGPGGLSPALLEALAERRRVTEPENLKRAGVVGADMIALFILGEQVHLLPAVTALMGATALLVWIRPNIEEMIEAVDWTTLVFFMTLFICVGAIQEVGLISVIADLIGRLVGDSLPLAMIVVG